MRTTLRARSALGLASVAVLSLSLSACAGGADGAKASGSAGASATHPESGAGKAIDSSAGRSAKSEAQDPSSAAPAKDPKSDGGSAGDECVPGTTKLTLKEADGKPSAALLTATNNGPMPCSVYHAPFVADPIAGHRLTTDPDTKPQAVVTLAPGRTAYAAIVLKRQESTQNHRTKTLHVTLATKANTGTGGPTTVSSPSPAGLQINPSTRVTYWQSTEEGALR